MITPEQCRSARAWLDWSQEDLAAKAKVSLSTVRDFEKGRRIPIENNIEAIQQAFEAVGVFPETSNGEPSGIRIEHRIKERDTYIPVLEYLDDAPDGFLKTKDLIVALQTQMHLSAEDRAILDNRSDSRFSQIVRNIVSHRDASGNLIQMGWAEYDKVKRGLRITPAGRQYLVAEQERLKSGL